MVVGIIEEADDGEDDGDERGVDDEEGARRNESLMDLVASFNSWLRRWRFRERRLSYDVPKN